jgi:hypothetical protein
MGKKVEVEKKENVDINAFKMMMMINRKAKQTERKTQNRQKLFFIVFPHFQHEMGKKFGHFFFFFAYLAAFLIPSMCSLVLYKIDAMHRA